MNGPKNYFRGVDGLVVSIVSHGHAEQVSALLRQMADGCAASVSRVVLTLNVPEPQTPFAPPSGGWPFAVQIVRNAAPLGFGANHNRALAGAQERFVCVLNPDVVLLPQEGDAMGALCQAASSAGAGMAYPIQVDATGVEQDSRRELTTPWSLIQRRLLRRPQTRCDWVNAACVVLPNQVWQAVAGFDEKFFMYCEDVDLSLRVQLAGWRLAAAPVRIVHAGQRASGRQWLHFKWHVQSLWTLWQSPAYAKALRRLRNLGHLTP